MESRLLVVSSQKSTHVSNYNVVLGEVNIMLLTNVTPMEKKNKMKRQPTEEKLFAVFLEQDLYPNYVENSYNSLIKKEIQIILRWAKYMNEYFTKLDISMANNHRGKR